MPTTTTTSKMTHDSPMGISSSFTVDGQDFKFQAATHTPLPRFTTREVTLHYNSLDELTGNHKCRVFLGPTGVSLSLDNGVEMEAEFEGVEMEEAEFEEVESTGYEGTVVWREKDR